MSHKTGTILQSNQKSVKMDLSELPSSPIQTLIGLLSAAIALAGSYWIYRRSKRDEEIRWRIENIYETGLEELNAVIDEDQFPGITRNRQEASFWDDISNWKHENRARRLPRTRRIESRRTRRPSAYHDRR